MSEVSQGPGWWIASDGKWYPPELHPSVTEATPDDDWESLVDLASQPLEEPEPVVTPVPTPPVVRDDDSFFSGKPSRLRRRSRRRGR